MKVYEATSARMADENSRRDEAIKSFLYSIRNDTRDHK